MKGAVLQCEGDREAPSGAVEAVLRQSFSRRDGPAGGGRPRGRDRAGRVAACTARARAGDSPAQGPAGGGALPTV